VSFEIGARVRFRGELSDEPRLSGQTGSIAENDKFCPGDYVVKLDNAVDGFYSGMAWAHETELEIIP
jgi:hypothetical protein